MRHGLPLFACMYVHLLIRKNVASTHLPIVLHMNLVNFLGPESAGYDGHVLFITQKCL